MKLNYKRTFLVGLAFFLICVFWQAYDTLVAITLVNKFGLNQTWSGVIMALDNILALFMLPLFGSLSDRAKGRTFQKYGKRTPFIVIGTVLAVICFFSLSVIDAQQLKQIESVSNTETIAETLWDNENENIVIDNPYFGADKTGASQDLEFIDTSVQNGTVRQIYTGGEEMFKSIYLTNDKGAKTVAEPIAIQTADPLIYNPYYRKTADVPKGADTKIYRGRLSEIYDAEEGGMTFDQICRKVLDGSDEEFVKQYKPLVTAANSGMKTAFTDIVAPLRSAYVREITSQNSTNLILFIVVLLALLIAMSTFRSPAVALMPAVTVKPLRSKANAIINIMGVIGGSLVLGLGMVMGTGQASNALMNYIPFISVCCAVMLVAVIVFMFTVKEPRFCAEMEQTTAEHGLDESEETQAEQPKNKLRGGKLRSFIFLMLSIAFWFMGYNAVTSKYSLYALNVLQMDYNTTLLIAQIAALIAFFPAGMLATKIGRKKTIMGGIVLLTASFVTASFMRSNSSPLVMNILFIMAGVAWASINVNSLPMVVELATGADVGKYTGFYYTASMAAQTLTPILSGSFMDVSKTMEVLFPYAAVFVALSFVTMIFVRHGDSKPEKKTIAEAAGSAD